MNLPYVVLAQAGASPSPAAEAPTPPSADESVDTIWRSVLDMYESALAYLPTLAIALVVVVVTAFAAKIAVAIGGKLLGRMHLRGSLQSLLETFIYIGIWLAGLAVAATILFPGFGIGKLLATAGLASIAIGFAFKDIFENFFAGVLLLWRYPFEKGDFIEVEGADVAGKVEDIQLRVSLIRQTDGQLIVAPNSTLYTNPVRVLTNAPLRRVTLVCGVAYDEDVDEARDVIRKAVESCDLVSKERDVEVFATEFADSSINFDIRWWTEPTPRDVFRSRDQVVGAVKRALDEAGIEIPFPVPDADIQGKRAAASVAAYGGVRAPA